MLSNERMNEMTIQELTEYYNKLAKPKGRQPVKKFSQKSSAKQRIREIEFYEPFRGLEHAVQPGSIRGVVLEALRQGATMEQIEALAKEIG